MIDPDSVTRFVATALARGLIDQDQAEKLRRDSLDNQMPAEQSALDAGWMSPTEIEIVQAFVEPDDLVPGYRLLDVLGQGALGVVYRARQDRLGRDVAIKAILQARLAQSNVLPRFLQEAATIGRLQHPNIVAAYDSGSHRGRVYLVMELVDGSDLRSWIQRRPLPPQHALSIVRQTAAGLANAFSHGIVHRDIKPANLLATDAPTGFDSLGGAPLVKIADFGLAQLGTMGDAAQDATRLTMTGATLGTPMYGAPEQLTGDAVDHRADIYGLGATLFSMLSGQPPFADAKLHTLITAKISGEPPRMDLLPSDLPDGVRELVLDMTRADPADRPADYPSLVQRVDEIMGTAKPQAIASSIVSTSQSQPNTKRNRRLIGILAAALIALVAGWFAYPIWQARFAGPPPNLVQTPWSESMFDGEDISGWRSRKQSSTRDQEDNEGAKVMAVRGMTVKTGVPLPPEFVSGATNGTPADTGFGFNVIVDLQQASAAEVRFGFDDDDLVTAGRHVVRITPSEISLGYRQGEDAAIELIGEPVSVPSQTNVEDPRRCELQIRWFGGRWSVLANDQPLGSSRSENGERVDTLELVAMEGEAYFADLFVFGVRPAPAS